MRSLSLILVVLTAWASPLSADPLRDMAMEYFGPLPTLAPEIDGNPATAEKLVLGQALYFDTRLSASGQLSCNGCHNLAEGGDDGLATPIGPDGQPGLRNTSTILNALLNASHFWDGRDVDLASQGDGPIKHGLTLMNPPEAILAMLNANPGYAAMFAAAFPGEADPVSYDNTAMALEVFSATLLTPGPFDAWLGGDDAALSDVQKAGLQVFMDQGCSFCHYGPNLGGDGYYPLGLVEKPSADVLSTDEAQFAVADTAAEEFIFRTAPLRNSAVTGPYFHSGRVADLSVAVGIMAENQLGSPLAPEDINAVVAFLDSLTGVPPVLEAPVLP